MSIRAAKLIRLSMLAVTLTLAAGCHKKSDDADLAKLDNQLTGNNADPALTQQSNKLAARAPAAPAQAQYPAPRAGQQIADAGCIGNVEYGSDWARRLPAAFAVYPGGRITEAAGNDKGDCNIRAVSFTTATPPARLLDWYAERAAGAGYSADRDQRDGDQILAGTSGDNAYYLIVTPTASGSDAALIANDGR
jgi:hypothetical protein